MYGIELYTFGDRLAIFLREMPSHFDMRVLIFGINQSHFIRIGIFVSADLRFNSNEKLTVLPSSQPLAVVTNLIIKIHVSFL